MYAVDPETAIALTSPSGTHVETGSFRAAAAALAGSAAKVTIPTAIASHNRNDIRAPIVARGGRRRNWL